MVLLKEYSSSKLNMPRRDYYMIKTNYSNYYVEIFHQYPTIDKVYIGGKTRCVTLSIFLDGDDPNIDGIGYDETCNTTNDLAQGIGTRHMVVSALAFIGELYKTKQVSQIYMLRDTSKINCKGFDMYLPFFYMLHHRKSWYQKHFGASNKVESYNDDIVKFKAYLKTKPDALFECVKSKQRKEYLEHLYSSCENIKELLKKVKKLDCSILKGWGPELVQKFMPYIVSMEWTIDASKLDKHSINIEYIGTQKPANMMIHTGGSHAIFKSI